MAGAGSSGLSTAASAHREPRGWVPAAGGPVAAGEGGWGGLPAPGLGRAGGQREEAGEGGEGGGRSTAGPARRG